MQAVESISYKPDISLTDLQSQDFHSVFGQHFMTYVQHLSFIGL